MDPSGLRVTAAAAATVFLVFATDRWEKSIKVIKIDMKIDAVDPWAAADNPPATLRSQWSGQVYAPLHDPTSTLCRRAAAS